MATTYRPKPRTSVRGSRRSSSRPNLIENRRCTRYNIGVLLEERDSLGWVMKALREAGSSLVMEFVRADEEMLCQRLSEGEWCLKEIAAHLRDAEELALRQMTAIAGDGAATLPLWDVDALPAERDYRSEDISALITEFRGLRNETSMLLWSVTNTDWQASARHPYRGVITFETIARELAQHDLEHLWQVRRLKFALGIA